LEQSLDVNLCQIGIRGRFLEAATNDQSSLNGIPL
jgi:hypothetical protein